MISVDGLTVEFGGTTLFQDVSFVINEKDRIALMGKNGAGKSTLLKILAGARTATRGNISAPKDTVIAYLPQHLNDGKFPYGFRRNVTSIRPFIRDGTGDKPSQ